MSYVRESWFAGEHFDSLQAARDHARIWCRDVAGARIHGTTRAVPREVFERDEQPRLRPAPEDVFDVPHWCEAKAHPDHHLQVLKALYSVPTRNALRLLTEPEEKRRGSWVERTVALCAHDAKD